MYQFRYLTKMCSNIVALVSDDDASKIVWLEQGPQNDDEEALTSNHSQRFTSFEVVETKEESDDVSARPGFTVGFAFVDRKLINDGPTSLFEVMLPETHKQGLYCPSDPKLLTPCLVPGETIAGYLNVRYESPHRRVESLSDRLNSLQVQHIL